MKIKAVILTILLAIQYASFGAESDGPFGLSWGMTKSQVGEYGVKLEPKAAQGNMEFLVAKSLPKNLSIAESYALSFDKKFHLQRVEMVSKDIDGDIYGTEGKTKFSALKESLTKKYGQPSIELERVGMKLWKDSDEFYQCLAYAGCGLWVALFEDKESGQNIGLALKGLGRGKGYIDLTYEGPKWSDVVDAIKQHQLKSDEGAL